MKNIKEKNADELSEEPVSHLIPLLTDADWYVRLQTAWSLLRKPASELTPAIPALITALEYEDLFSESLRILKKIGIPAIPALLKTLENKNFERRNDVIETLGGMPFSPAVVSALIRILGENDTYAAEKAAEALVKIGQDATQALIQELEDENSALRIVAAKILGKIKAPEVVPILIKLLEAKDKALRNVAVESLGVLGPDAVPGIIQFLEANPNAENIIKNKPRTRYVHSNPRW
jgi:HEAT repeat protein